MTIDDILGRGDGDIPTAAELLAVCDELGLRVGTDPEGRPSLKCRAHSREAAVALSRLLRREPWRSQVVASRLGGQVVPTAVPPKPRILYWRTSTPEAGILTSILAETTVEEYLRKHRCYLRRHVPYAATAWATHPGGPWRPVGELPPEWGLRRVDGSELPTEEDEGDE